MDVDEDQDGGSGGAQGTAATDVLCFVEADWPLIGGSFVIDDVSVLWPRKIAAGLIEPGVIAGAFLAA